jgi:hypothetical protein
LAQFLDFLADFEPVGPRERILAFVHGLSLINDA